MAISSYVHLTTTGAGTKSGDDWANAMDWAARVATPPVAGEVTFIKPGTYTMTAGVNFYGHSPDPESPILLLGVKSGTTNEGAAVVYSDWERDQANLPYIDAGAYSLIIGGSVIIRNISYRSTDLYGLRFYGGHNQVLENCKVLNDSATADQNAVYAGGLYPRFINCDMQCTNGNILSQSTDHTIVYCYLHDSKYAAINVPNIVAIYNIFKNVTKSFTACDNPRIIGNTYYECGEAISPNGSIQTILNNLIEGSTVAGIKADTQFDNSLYWGNHGNDARNVDMWVNVDTTSCFQDYKVTVGDPMFQNPGTNFALQLGSPCARTSEDLFLAIGAVPSHSNKGAWQGPEIDPAIALWPDATNVDPLADPFGPNGDNYTPSMDVPALNKVAPSDTLRSVSGTMDIPDISKVAPSDTLEGVTGTMDLPALNRVSPNDTLEGVPGTQDLPGISNVRDTDTLEGVTGGLSVETLIAEAQAANNSAPTLGEASLVVGSSVMVDGTTYDGNVIEPVEMDVRFAVEYGSLGTSVGSLVEVINLYLIDVPEYDPTLYTKSSEPRTMEVSEKIRQYNIAVQPRTMVIS